MRSLTLSSIFRPFGRALIEFLRTCGQVTLFVARTLIALVRPPFYTTVFLTQLAKIGYNSLPVVALTTFFTGGVLALQISHSGNKFNSPAIIASIVALGITRELAPVLAGLMVAGRCSASMAAEIGTMRVTEQIDALTTLSTNPYQYLVIPKLLASIIVLPLLVLVGDVLGIFGGMLATIHVSKVSGAMYVRDTWSFLTSSDITSGMIKAAVFGGIIGIMGCFFGFTSQGGAQGVGRSTTNAVVLSSILILITNYIMTSAFFS